MTDSTDNSLDLLWGAEEIAKVIRRTRRQTFAMLDNGELPARKVGGRWVIERAELAAVFTGKAS
ncbi:helix-turn-helix domain-containing protein [Aureimonas sp. ME7]|uniref:helix-turn-helix domain-containing protein n=1 Tax=Aureimonas sp. ME7 TaxID=2744252 RepID=UPI001FCF22F6|nr:helix-turn-helix domain-containing protein [Aureimonas sp. ME7]